MALIPLEGLGAPSQKTSLLGRVAQILINPRPSPCLADVGLFVQPKSQQQVLNDDIFRVISCKFAYNIWYNLVVTHKRTSQVKKAKIDLFYSQHENFSMDENESIDDIITCFTKITNGLFF